MFEDEEENEDEDDLDLHPLVFKFLEGFHKIHREPRRNTAVDDAMVVRDTNRQHPTSFDLVTAYDGFLRTAPQPKDCHFRLVDDGRECTAADPALVRDGE